MKPIEATFFVRTELEVVDRDLEMADIDNPNGDIIREIAYLYCEAPNGSRWVVARLGEEVRPEALGWLQIDPAYGSEAYQNRRSL